MRSEDEKKFSIDSISFDSSVLTTLIGILGGDIMSGVTSTSTDVLVPPVTLDVEASASRGIRSLGADVVDVQGTVASVEVSTKRSSAVCSSSRLLISAVVSSLCTVSTEEDDVDCTETESLSTSSLKNLSIFSRDYNGIDLCKTRLVKASTSSAPSGVRSVEISV